MSSRRALRDVVQAKKDATETTEEHLRRHVFQIEGLPPVKQTQGTPQGRRLTTSVTTIVSDEDYDLIVPGSIR